MSESKTMSFYLSPAAQGYLTWAVKWLKTSQSGAVEEALRRLVEQYMTEGVVYTTWNHVAKALKNISGNWDGFEEREEDLEVALVALDSAVTDQPILGWLEVLVRNDYGRFDTCRMDTQGRGTNIQDFVPANLRPIAPKREGIAVPVEVLGYIQPD